MKNPDAVLFVVSAYSLSARALARLEGAALASSCLPARLIRLESTGPSLLDALSALRAEGYRHIRVQPLGLPFSESLLHWLPGALAEWQTRNGNQDTILMLGQDPALGLEKVVEFSAACLDSPAKPIAGMRPSLGKKGWNLPPDFDFHLLVCTGPRCHVHGAMPFLQMVQEECTIADISDRVLTTQTACIYPCNKGPVLVLYPHGHWYQLPDRTAIRAFVREVLVAGRLLSKHRFHTARLARVSQ